MGIVPDAMIGEGVGQYTAACLDNVFSLEDALVSLIQGEPVKEAHRFLPDFQGLLKEKKSIFIEIGPGNELSRQVKKCLEKEAWMVENPAPPVLHFISPSRTKESELGHVLQQIGLLWLYRQKI